MEKRHLTDVVFKLSIDLGIQLEGSPELRGIDLSPMHMRILRLLHDREKATPVDISSAIQRDRGHVTRLLTDLTQKNLAILAPNPADGRSKVVRLTREAEDIFQRVRAAELKIIDRAKAGVPDEDFSIFLRVAHKISGNLSGE